MFVLICFQRGLQEQARTHIPPFMAVSAMRFTITLRERIKQLGSNSGQATIQRYLHHN